MHAHILFVEETEGFLQPLRAALEGTGLTTSVVHGSEDLGRLLRSVCPDLVVIEAGAPSDETATRPASIEVCRHTYPWLPVVVQLNDPSGHPNGLAKRLGADLVLESPDPDGESTWRIRRLLGGRRLGQDA